MARSVSGLSFFWNQYLLCKLLRKMWVIGFQLFVLGTDVESIIYISMATGTWYNARVSKSPCEYCLFGDNYFFMLVLEIEASKSLRNDLKTCQCHRNDPSV